MRPRPATIKAPRAPLTGPCPTRILSASSEWRPRRTRWSVEFTYRRGGEIYDEKAPADVVRNQRTMETSKLQPSNSLSWINSAPSG